MDLVHTWMGDYQPILRLGLVWKVKIKIMASYFHIAAKRKIRQRFKKPRGGPVKTPGGQLEGGRAIIKAPGLESRR